jgi:glyoxylase-like metal-dependent hydrolase (beta-lactamase superfamily II)
MIETVPLPYNSATSQDRIAPGVMGLRVVMVNVYAVKDWDSTWVLIDAGLPLAAGKILRWVESHFGAGARPSCILMTHGHFDHAGSLEQLAEEWDVPVYAHPLELPYLTGKSKYPPPDPTVGGGAMSLLSPLYSRGPINLGKRAKAIPADGVVPGLRDWKWIHTPGHTAGHISFFREDDRVLIAGDAFVTTKQESLLAVVTQRLELHGPPAYFTSDWDAASLSVQRLSNLMPNVIATGHGLPVDGPEAAAALEALASRFDLLARPTQGRYVHSPAVTDERGIVSLPPSVPNPMLSGILLGTAVAGALMYYSRRRARSSY